MPVLNSDEFPVGLDEIEAVRHRVQLFDPVGCATSNLAEHFVSTIRTASASDPLLMSVLTKKIISEDIELLGQHNYRQLMKNHQIHEKTVEDVLAIIQSLNPKPGTLIHHDITEYIIPDITVKKVEGEWKVFSKSKRTAPTVYQFQICCFNSAC